MTGRDYFGQAAIDVHAIPHQDRDTDGGRPRPEGGLRRSWRNTGLYQAEMINGRQAEPYELAVQQREERRRTGPHPENARPGHSTRGTGVRNTCRDVRRVTRRRPHLPSVRRPGDQTRRDGAAVSPEMEAARIATVPQSCSCRWDWMHRDWVRRDTADGCPWHTRSPQ